MAAFTLAEVGQAEERLLQDRRLANELVALMDAAAGAGDSAVRLAATQACRSLFAAWADAGELRIGPRGAETQEEVAAGAAADATAAAGAGAGSRQAQALLAYREWLEEKYRRFVAALHAQLRSAEASPALRSLALDSLMLLAAAEVRYARPGRGVHHPALGAGSGALSQAVAAIAACEDPLPPLVLRRLSEAHVGKLDVAFYLMRHVQRLARPGSAAADGAASASATASRAERLMELMLLVTPPPADADPSDAPFLVPPSDDPAAGADRWPAAARCLLQRKRHQKEFVDAWRAVVELPLPRRAYRVRSYIYIYIYIYIYLYIYIYICIYI